VVLVVVVIAEGLVEQVVMVHLVVVAVAVVVVPQEVPVVMVETVK
jgi:hypothetical protein